MSDDGPATTAPSSPCRLFVPDSNDRAPRSSPSTLRRLRNAALGFVWLWTAATTNTTPTPPLSWLVADAFSPRSVASPWGGSGGGGGGDGSDDGFGRGPNRRRSFRRCARRRRRRRRIRPEGDDEDEYNDDEATAEAGTEPPCGIGQFGPSCTTRTYYNRNRRVAGRNAAYSARSNMCLYSVPDDDDGTNSQISKLVLGDEKDRFFRLADVHDDEDDDGVHDEDGEDAAGVPVEEDRLQQPKSQQQRSIPPNSIVRSSSIGKNNGSNHINNRNHNAESLRLGVGPPEGGAAVATTVVVANVSRTVGATSSSSSSSIPPEPSSQPQQQQRQRQRQRRPSLRVRDNLRALWPLTRPSNFPGVVALHAFGVYMALRHHLWLSTAAAAAGGGTATAASTAAAAAVTRSAFLRIAFHPSVCLTLVAILLTSSTSMIINDYYDAKLGRDRDTTTTTSTTTTSTSDDIKGSPTHPTNTMALVADDATPHTTSTTKATTTATTTATTKHPIATGDISLRVVRKFLTYLYGGALLVLACVPGIPTRLSVVIGLMMTYEYTQHLKPITWLKNVVCATLIALAPLTSAAAALTVLQQQQHAAATAGTTIPAAATAGAFGGALASITIPSIWNAFGFLFCTFVGREMLMDCSDLENDTRSSIWTVPVKYGTRYAARTIVLLWSLSCIVATTGPALDLASAMILGQQGSGSGGTPLTTKMATTIVRRFVFAVTGSCILLRQGYQVFKYEGRNETINDHAIEMSMVPNLLFLASTI